MLMASLASKEVSVSQQANSVTYAVTDVTLAAPADIPASGGSVSSTTVTAKGSQTYTSGSVTSDVALTNGSMIVPSPLVREFQLLHLVQLLPTELRRALSLLRLLGRLQLPSPLVDVYQAANTATYGDITFDSAVATEVSLKADVPKAAT